MNALEMTPEFCGGLQPGAGGPATACKLPGECLIKKMKTGKVRLFIKPFCGWCHEAIEWLEMHGIEHETLDVLSDAGARQEMIRLSGQTLTPVLAVDGEVLADFDTEQLEEFWKQRETGKE